MTHYPGIGLNDKLQEPLLRLRLHQQPAGGSIIWMLVSVKPKGASFEVTELQPFIKQMVPTDCEFGPDGAFYWQRLGRAAGRSHR